MLAVCICPNCVLTYTAIRGLSTNVHSDGEKGRLLVESFEAVVCFITTFPYGSLKEPSVLHDIQSCPFDLYCHHTVPLAL